MQSRASFRQVALLGLISLAIPVAGYGQIPNERSQGVEGKYQGFNNAGVMIDERGVASLIKVGRDTDVRLRAPASEDYLSPGLAVQVQGRLDPNTNIVQANDVLIFVNSGGPRVVTNRGAYIPQEMRPTDTTLPIVLIGQIVSGKPLQVKGGGNFRSTYFIRGPNGQTFYREIPTSNKVFAVEAKSNDIRADFLGGLQLARQGDHTFAWVGITSRVAHEVFVNRRDVVALEEIGITDGKALAEDSNNGKAKKPAKKKNTKTDSKESDSDRDVAKKDSVKTKKTKPEEKPSPKEGDNSDAQSEPAKTKKKPLVKFDDDE